MPIFSPPAEIRIAVVGLGYVGLPLAAALGQVFDTIGFDVNKTRVQDLQKNFDITGEVETRTLAQAQFLRFSSDETDLVGRNVFIVAVPSPIDVSRRPDLTPLISASRTVGRALQKGGVVIYESTVYPGATEEDCLPVVEQVSGLRFRLQTH